MKTFYQVWRLNPDKDTWFHYKHIPDCESLEVCQELFQDHKTGGYRANQFKPWMRDWQFKIVCVIQSITDEINPV